MYHKGKWCSGLKRCDRIGRIPDQTRLISSDRVCYLDDGTKLTVGPFFKYFAAKSGTFNFQHNFSFYFKQVTFNQKHFLPFDVMYFIKLRKKKG